MKNFINKIVCKIFGKRCECKDVPPAPTHCVRCNDLLKDCTCTNQAPA